MSDLLMAVIYAICDRAQGVNKRLAHFIGLSSLEASAVNIVVVCHTTPTATRDFGGWYACIAFHAPALISCVTRTTAANAGQPCILAANMAIWCT